MEVGGGGGWRRMEEDEGRGGWRGRRIEEEDGGRGGDIYVGNTRISRTFETRIIMMEEEEEE